MFHIKLLILTLHLPDMKHGESTKWAMEVYLVHSRVMKLVHCGSQEYIGRFSGIW